jgi:hypothetical protein
MITKSLIPGHTLNGFLEWNKRRIYGRDRFGRSGFI